MKYLKYGFCIIVAFLFLVLLFCFTMDYVCKLKFVSPELKFNSTITVDSLTDARASKDSINLRHLIDRTDSISKVTSDISRRYQDDINLMIYKTTQWLTFWLAAISVFFAAITLFQFSRNRRYSAEFEKVKEKAEHLVKEETNRIQKAFNENTVNMETRIHIYIENMERKFNSITEGVEEKINQRYSLTDAAIEKLQKNLDGLSKNISQSSSENEVTSLMMCISSFPDPAMFGSVPKKKIYLRYYLEKLRMSFVEYINHINFDAMNDNEMNKLSVVLASLKYVIVRSQNVFSAYHQNITFDKLLKDINLPLEDIVERNVLNNDIKDKLLGISNTFKTMINDISIE